MKLLKRIKKKKIILVTHGAVSQPIECYFNGIPEDGAFLKLGLKNGDVKEYKL